MPPLVVYGADWCHDTRSARAELDRLGVPYEYVEVEADADAQSKVERINGGQVKMPTILAGDDETNAIVEPSDQQLDQFLRNRGYLA